MRRRSILALALVLCAALGLNLGVAFADGWFWNARLDIEGVETRTVWSVPDDPDGADFYRAHIRVSVPRNADAKVLAKLTEDERVVIVRTPRLSCTAEGVEVAVNLLVLPKRGADGSDVAFNLVADGTVVASASGSVRHPIDVQGVLPTGGNHSC